MSEGDENIIFVCLFILNHLSVSVFAETACSWNSVGSDVICARRISEFSPAAALTCFMHSQVKSL